MQARNLWLLIERAGAEVDASLQQRARLQQRLVAAEDQLALLRSYAIDYVQRAQARRSTGGDPAERQNWHDFALRLEQAITAQRSEVGRRAQQLAAGDRELQAARRRLKSLQALADRREAAAQATARRLDQKQTDEIARTVRGPFSSIG